MKMLLTKYGIKGVDHYIDHYICYDFECILKPIPAEVTTPFSGEKKSTQYTHHHIPVSVSVCDSLTRKTQSIVSDSPMQLLNDMFGYMAGVQKKICDYNLEKFSRVTKPILNGNGVGHVSGFKLTDKFSSDEIEKTISPDNPMFQSDFDNPYRFHSWNEFLCRHIPIGDFKTFQRLMFQVPVIGFNSACYDINVIRNELFSVIGKVERAIRAHSGYMCISTDRFKMLDVSKFLAVGTTYEKYNKPIQWIYDNDKDYFTFLCDSPYVNEKCMKLKSELNRVKNES